MAKVRPPRIAPVAWWLAKEDGKKPHEGVFSHLDSFNSYSQRRRNRALRAARKVNADLSGFGEMGGHEERDFDTFAFNRIFSGVRAIAAKVTATRVMPFIVTEGADFQERDRADEFNKACVAILEEQGIYDSDYALATDALTFEGACVVGSKKFGVPCLDRAKFWELLFDPLEARYGWKGIRTLYHSFLIDRDQVLALWPNLTEDEKLQVYACGLEKNDRSFYGDTTANVIRLIHAWHLPSGPEADDGREVICIRNLTLEENPYTWEKFPVAVMYQQPPQIGVCQVSFVERNANAQRTVDKLTDSMADSVDIASKLRVLKKASTTMTELDDMNAKVYEWDGQTPPQEWSMNPFHPASFQFLQWVSEGITTNEGVSDMSSSGQLPQGLRDASGKALIVADDTFSEQLSPFMHSRQLFYCDLGEIALQLARECAEENEGYVINIVDGRTIRKVKFKDIDVGAGKYKSLVQPASYLSKSPSAKYKQLSEMRQNGDISQMTFLSLMGVPDVTSANEMDTAMQTIIDKTIDKILSDGLTAVAEPFDNLELIVERGTKAYHLSRVKDLPPDRQLLLLGYIRSAYDEKKRQDAEKAPPPPMPGPPMGGPPPGPMPPPGPPPGPPGPMPPPMPMAS